VAPNAVSTRKSDIRRAKAGLAGLEKTTEVFDLHAFRERIKAVRTAALTDLDTDVLSPTARLQVQLALNALDSARIHVELAASSSEPRDTSC
jgi:hypothetical protein